MANPQGDFIWYELITPDPTAAKAFYESVVGWSVSTGHNGDDNYGFITRGDGGMAGGVLRLSPDMAEHGAKPGWLGYLHARDVDATAQEFVDAGGAIRMGPHDMAGVGRFALIADPQGAAIYLMTPTPPAENPDATSDVFSVDQPQHVRWNELWTRDPDAAIALYTRLLGWTQEGDMDMGPMGKYRFLQNNGIGIGAVGKATADGPGSRWDYYIGVEDIDRASRAVADGGGRLAGQINEIPGGEFAVRCTDPQGAAFGLVGPRKN